MNKDILLLLHVLKKSRITKLRLITMCYKQVHSSVQQKIIIEQERKTSRLSESDKIRSYN